MRVHLGKMFGLSVGWFGGWAKSYVQVEYANILYIYTCICIHLGYMCACMGIHIYTNTLTHIYNLGYHDLNPQN